MVNDVDTSGIADFDAVCRELEAGIGPFVLNGVSRTFNGHVLKVTQHDAVLGIKFARGAEAAERAASIRKEAAVLQALGRDLTHGAYRASGRSQQTEYLVTRWVGDTSLSVGCKALRDIGDHAQIARECAAASEPIRALNAAGWLHCDVQPAHCIRAINGGYQLIDFGWAQRIGADNGYRGAMIHFASPCVAAQMRSEVVPVEYTAADEVFSFIAVTFFCLYGKPIWDYGGAEGRVGRQHGLDCIVRHDHASHIHALAHDGRYADFFTSVVCQARDGGPVAWNDFDNLCALAEPLRSG